MIRRIIKSGVEGRTALAEGARKIAEAVSGTVGPFGQNWFLDKGGNKITNDGVSIAREFQLPDEVENRGAAAIREAAVKTVEEVGDGTSTAILLAYAIYQEAARLLPRELVIGSKKTGAQIRKQIEDERLIVNEKLLAMATPIETEAQLIDAATVSTEDRTLGELIGKAQWELGKDGYLLAEETAERVSSVERVKGIRIDNGYGTSMAVNNIEKQTLELKDIPVLLTSYTIKDFGVLAKPFDSFLKTGQKEIVVIARAWTEEAINLCQQNHKNGFKIYPMNAPYIDMQQRFLDIAAVTGAVFYDSENSDMRDIDIAGFGFIKKLVAGRFDAIITGKDDEYTKLKISERVGDLAVKMTGSQSDHEKKQLAERIAQLKDGFGIIKIGSPSDIERERLFDKAEDAVHSVRVAFQEGTVPGAGLAFKQIAEELPTDALLRKPLLALNEQIMSTAPDGFVVEPWVRDPVKVLRVALEKACAAASAFATAGGVITQAFPKELDELIGKKSG